MNLYLDIETIPTQLGSVRDRIVNKLYAELNAKPVPKTRQKDFTAWRDEQGTKTDAAIDKEYRDTALSGTYGELAVICWAIDDGPVQTVSRTNGASEHKMLATFYAAIEAQMTYQFVGHNIPFDLRFLWHRSIVLGIKPTVYIPHELPPWRGAYYDTMYHWHGARGGVKLTELCDALGIDVEDEIDGSQVWDYWRDGRHDVVRDHCIADVERVRQVYKRMTWQ